MTAKTVTYGEAARNLLQQGIDILADTVRPTLGPRSRCVILEKSFGAPLIINDGATIAKEIELKDHLANLGVKMVREVATRTNDVAGDGTTTAMLLARAICREGRKMVSAGRNPMGLKRGIEKAVEAVVASLKDMAAPADTSRAVVQVSTLSANNDPVIGDLIGQAMEKTGKSGVITVEESKGMETTLEMVDGLRFDKGYLSPYFLTDAERRVCELNEPYILVHEGKISSIREALPILEKVTNQGRPLLMIAEDLQPEVLATLVVNKLRGILKVCAVKAPGFGDRRKAMLQDIAVLTGAQLLSKDLGFELSKIGLEVLGIADMVAVTREHTTIVGGSGDKPAIEARIARIRHEILETTSDYDREKLQERLSKLAGGVAVVKVGAATDVEMKEKKARVEDAMNAAQAAVEEGIVPGGGVALIRCLRALDRLRSADDDEAAGIKVVSRALKEPLRQLAVNAGADGDMVVQRVLSGQGTFGFNAATEEFEDLMRAGVIDPAKVVRVALQNAASIASLVLTTEAAVTIKPKADHEPEATSEEA
jgi:chaperonin GroEL